MQRDEMMGKRVFAPMVKPQCHLAGCLEDRFGPRVPAGKQGDFVALPNQLLSQIRYHPLGAAIKLRRAALVKWRNLRNPHLPKTPNNFAGTRTVPGTRKFRGCR